MFAGQKCRTRKTDDGLQVEIGPDQWHLFSSKADAELVASAGLLFCEPLAPTSMLRDTIKVMERTGVNQHQDVLAVYDDLAQELRRREAKR